jgi:uncharacterized membrane protein YhhN
MSETIPLVTFLVFAVANWVAVARGDKPLEYLTKPAVLVALIVYAVVGPDASAWLITALALSLLGDVYLMLPTDVFGAGLGAFLLAHLAYIVDLPAPLGPRLLFLAGALLATAPVTLRIMRAADGGALRVGVAAYMFTIALMAASALASGLWVAALGAILFVTSDSILGWNRFVRSLPWARPAIMVTYHLGQLGLVYALRG